MKERKILCFIDARFATKTEEKKWLDGIKGQSSLAILNKRLKSIHNNCNFLLALNTQQAELAKEAERLDWDVRIDERCSECFLLSPDYIGREKLKKTDFIYVCSLDEPFMDADQIAGWKMQDFKPETIVSGQSDNNPYIPKKFYSRAFVEYRIKLNELFSSQFTEAQCQSIMCRYGISVSPPELAENLVGLTADTFELRMPQLVPDCFAVKDMETMLASEAMLKSALKTSASTAFLNSTLNQIEISEKREALNSLPANLSLNLTSSCSVHCTFCSIQPKTQKIHDFVTLDEIKKMTWLNNVEWLNIWGGIGDSLVNKEFVPIVQYLHNTFPYLKLNLCTNGILLNEEICAVLAESLSFFNVSINAATKATWEKIMRAKGFDNVCKGIRRIAELRKKPASPSIAVRTVITRDNIHEAVAFVELAHELGADIAGFFHYVPSTLAGRRDLSVEQSLYYDKKLSDRMLAKAEKRAQELKLEYTGPVLFNKKADYIYFGVRSLTSAPVCHDPWRTCYLTVDEDGKRQMVFCCSSFYYNVEYDKGSLDEENFRKVWNHPAARYFRRTVHKPGANPICGYCTGTDRADPTNRQNYAINEKIQPYFEEINRRYKAGEEIDTEKMEQDIRALFNK